jgi:transposase
LIASPGGGNASKRLASYDGVSVERTIAWLNRNRRLAKDFEATVESTQAWLFIASVKLLSRRLARP